MIPEFAIMFMLGPQDASAATARDLERIEHWLAATWKAGDCTAWGAMVAPEWSVIHITGTTITKREALAMCRAPRQVGEDHKVD